MLKGVNEPRRKKNRFSDQENRHAQTQRQARSLKFRIKEEEGLYYPCSENKDADQLRRYCEADLRLFFRKGKYPVFSRCGFN